MGNGMGVLLWWDERWECSDDLIEAFSDLFSKLPGLEVA